MFKCVGIRLVAQFAGGIVRHILCLGDLPHGPVPEPEPSTHHIMPPHHEAVSAVLVLPLEHVVMVLDGATVGPLCVPAERRLGEDCCIYGVP